MTTMNSVQQTVRSRGVIASLHALDGGALVAVRDERAGDIAAREALLNASFGAERFGKTSERLREGRSPARGLSLIANVDGAVAGTVRLWHVAAGTERRILLLGPLAVDKAYRDLGIGGLLMREAIERAQARGYSAILLVGDEAYYKRFGFSAGVTTSLDLPGPVDRERFLGLEFETGALSSESGMVRATGAFKAGAAKAEPAIQLAA